MKKTVAVMLAFVMMCSGILVVSASDWAASNYGTYETYEGVIGKSTAIKMSLYVVEGQNSITGSYLYNKARQEIKLAGSYDAKTGKLDLGEQSPAAHPVDHFEGILLKSKSAYSGTFTDSKGKKSSFKVTMTHATMAEEGHRYALIGMNDDDKVTQLVSELQTAIAKGDQKKVAKYVHYPLNIKIKGKKVKISNATAFIKNYKGIMTKSLVKELVAAEPHYLFVRSEGVMFGSGGKNLWLSSDSKGESLYIIGINN